MYVVRRKIYNLFYDGIFSSRPVLYIKALGGKVWDDGLLYLFLEVFSDTVVEPLAVKRHYSVFNSFIKESRCSFVVGDKVDFLVCWLLVDEFLCKKRVEYRLCGFMGNGLLVLVNWCLTLPK